MNVRWKLDAEKCYNFPMIRRFPSLFGFLCLILCTHTFAEERHETLKVGVIMGSSGIGMARLIANPPSIPGTKIVFEKAGSIDVLLPKFVNGDIDIGILPPNVAAKLYSMAPKSIAVASIVGNSMLSLVTRDASVTSLRDLSGKTVFVAGQGSTPEYVLRTLLAKSGIPEGSVRLDFSLPSQEIPAALASGKIAYALIPEPFTTVAIMNAPKGAPLRRAFTLRAIWDAAGLGADFPMTLCVVRRDFAQANPEKVARFLAAYKDSIAWTQVHPDAAGPLVESAGLGLKAAVASQAIPSCAFVWIEANAARKPIESLLAVFLEFAPESIGGKLPDEGFYLK